MPDDGGPDAAKRIEAWFDERGWQVFDFQRAVWSAYARGESGLIHAPTGTGKSLAAWLGPVMQWMDAAGADDPGDKECQRLENQHQNFHYTIRMVTCIHWQIIGIKN